MNMTIPEAIEVLRNFKLDISQPDAFRMVRAIGMAEEALKKPLILNGILEEIEEEIQSKKHIWESLKNPPYSEFEQSCWITGMKNAKEIIQSHMADIPENNTRENGWIPVEERLPEREGRYLVTFRNPRNVGLVGYGTCRRDLFGREIGFGWFDLHEAEYFSRDAVIAWMPLPEPCRESEVEKDEENM